MGRPVPRNIDRPNRTAEYVFAFLGTYYPLMFMTHEVLFAFGSACFMVYFIYKVTLDKPEGQSYRLFYKYIQIGKMRPSPCRVKRFEI